MVKIFIDDKELQVREDSTILQAARENSIPIPTLCYLEGLNEIGACRLCAVRSKRTASPCGGVQHKSSRWDGNLYPYGKSTACTAYQRAADLIPTQLQLPYLCPQWQLPVTKSIGTIRCKHTGLYKKL